MLLTEYDEQAHIEYEKEISYEEGKAEGREEEREKLIMNCLKKGYTSEVISDFSDIPLEEVKAVEKKFLAMQGE